MSVSRRALLGFALGLPFALKQAATLELERPFSIPQFINEGDGPTYQGVPLEFFEDFNQGQPRIYWMNQHAIYKGDRWA